MRVSFEEPTGIWVRGADGQEAPLTFPAFLAAIEDGVVQPDDQVWSRIVTSGQWVRAADMRLFQMLTREARPAEPGTDLSTWPPPIGPQP